MPSVKKQSKKRISIYFIVPAPRDISPGQRFRFEHYLPMLEEHKIHFCISAFYSLEAWKSLYTKGNLLSKSISVLYGAFKRVGDLFRIPRYSYVYIYREAAPLGPPFFEWVITKLMQKKIIYDFDDAIWIPFTSDFNKSISRWKHFGKVSTICKWAYKVSVGNQYLSAFAKKYNKNVLIIPTVVNTDIVHNKLQNQEGTLPDIGWTGSFSTLKYLDIVIPVLQELQNQYDFTFIVIADKDPVLPLKKYRFIKWTREEEVDDLLKFKIGLMPLYDDELSKGKCGFKAIQYMALGIPAVVSPVGVNAAIVDDRINGFLCATEFEWRERLKELINNAALRISLGKAARQKIIDTYSVKTTSQLFMDLFK